MTDHMGSTCAHHFPHTKFHHYVAHSEFWIFDFFVIGQSEQIRQGLRSDPDLFAKCVEILNVSKIKTKHVF